MSKDTIQEINISRAARLVHEAEDLLRPCLDDKRYAHRRNRRRMVNAYQVMPSEWADTRWTPVPIYVIHSLCAALRLLMKVEMRIRAEESEPLEECIDRIERALLALGISLTDQYADEDRFEPHNPDAMGEEDVEVIRQRILSQRPGRGTEDRFD